MKWVALLQGGYHLVTGVWPLVHMSSFELITGRKRDDWLVKTVGALLAVEGGVLLLGARRGSVPPELQVLAAGTDGALAAVDVIYYRRGILRFVYLIDAAAEVALGVGWLVGLVRSFRLGRAASETQPAP